MKMWFKKFLEQVLVCNFQLEEGFPNSSTKPSSSSLPSPYISYNGQTHCYSHANQPKNLVTGWNPSIYLPNSDAKLIILLPTKIIGYAAIPVEVVVESDHTSPDKTGNDPLSIMSEETNFDLMFHR